MGEWLAISQWHECQRLARPNIVFEVQNVDGLSLFTAGTVALPAAPFDWRSPPVKFRAVAKSRPRHSSPIPLPKP